MFKKTVLISVLATLVSCKDKVSNTGSSEKVIQPVNDCSINDSKKPIMKGHLSVDYNGSRLTAPEVSWEKVTDECELSHYEVGIGSEPGLEDILAYTNIGNETKYAQKGLGLSYAKNYYYSVRAVDGAGNISTPLVSTSWQVFSPKSLTGLVLWLDAAEKSSLEDNEGDNPGDVSFSNEVKKWADLSGSSAIHNFVASGAARPNWDVTEGALRFNGSNHLMATADHADINTSVIGQRTLVTAIKTDSDISSRQVIYEEGGTVRGINIYIESNKLHCGFWNVNDDGDGAQAYTEVSEPIDVNKGYVITYVFDYSHFTGRNSADGTIECYVNGLSIGQVSTTSRLHAHSGDIGLGAMNDGSYFSNGKVSGDQYYFRGVIYEFLMYNSSHDQDDIEKVDRVLQAKWF